MYSGVPMRVPVAVTVAPPVVAPCCFAIPKSITRTTPRRSRMRFAVLRSRWTTPTSWMARRPSATWRVALQASAGDSPPPSRARRARFSPSTSSMQM